MNTVDGMGASRMRVALTHHRCVRTKILRTHLWGGTVVGLVVEMLLAILDPLTVCSLFDRQLRWMIQNKMAIYCNEVVQLGDAYESSRKNDIEQDVQGFGDRGHETTKKTFGTSAVMKMGTMRDWLQEKVESVFEQKQNR